MAGGLARTLQFMEILVSGESSAYMVSKGSSSNMGPNPVASSEAERNIFIVKTYNQYKQVVYTLMLSSEIKADWMTIHILEAETDVTYCQRFWAQKI